jgi:hypothetical protein
MTESGFDYDGQFYPVSFTAGAKDLILVERITALPIDEFQQAAMASENRPSILLGLLATSIRARHPDWSVERIYQMVMAVDDISEIHTIAGDSAETPTPGGQKEPSPDTSDSPSGESSPSPSQTSQTSGEEHDGSVLTPV